MRRTSCAWLSVQQETIRHCSLTRILWKPCQSPRSASSRLPGGERRSSRVRAALTISSLRRATGTTSAGKLRTRLVRLPWYRSAVARSPNEAITFARYRMHGCRATEYAVRRHLQSSGGGSREVDEEPDPIGLAEPFELGDLLVPEEPDPLPSGLEPLNPGTEEAVRRRSAGLGSRRGDTPGERP